MQGEPAERRKPPGRGRWRPSGQSRAEARGSEGRPGGRGGRSSGEEEEEEEEEKEERLNTKISSNQQTEDGGGDEEVLARGRGGVRERSGRRAASEGEGGGEGRRRRLRWRINQLEKEKLELTSLHYQEVCALQAELTRLRSAVERGEAQGAELRYQLAVSGRDGDALTVRAARLQRAVDELQEAADAARRARLQDQHALQQAAGERHRVVEQSERLHRELQEQEEALQEASRRREELQTEAQRLAKEVKVLMEREERSHKEKELLDQRIKTLQSNVEAERDAHLETRYTCEVIQLRLRDTEAVLVVARSGQQEAQCSLELLRSQLREAERAYSEEKERSGSTEHALQRLQEELEHCKSELSVVVETERKTTSDLCDRLKEETRRHDHTQALLQEALQAHSGEQEASLHLLQQLSETLAPHCREAQPAEHHGKRSPEETLQLLRTTMTSYQLQVDRSHKQVEEARSSSDRQQEEIQTLRLLCSQQEEQLQEAQQEVVRLQEEVSDWAAQSRELKAELQREKEKEEKEKEEQKERERKEQEEREKEVQHLTEQQQAERMEGLSFLHRLYQRLLAGCILLPQPQCMLDNFTWQELCDVIREQVDQLTSDLQAANQKVVHLQFVCNKKTVCVRQLQQNHKTVLLRLEESVKRREEAHTHTLTELQLHSDSLTSDLCASRARSSALLMACALLGGALRHAHGRLRSLCQQKALLCRRLEEREQLEEEVRRLVEALRGEEEEEEQEEERNQRRRRRAVRRWRRCVCVVLAVRRWRELGRRSTVLLWVEGGGGAPRAGVCAGDEEGGEDEDGEGGGVCARWLRSQRLSPAVLSSLSDLQVALRHHGSAHPAPAARSALTRLLRHFLHQSDADAARRVPPQTDVKALVSALQQHFLLFSQRLHSAEVERRSLRMEVANLKRELQQEMVSAQRFHSVCEELRQALRREDEAQDIIREQRHTTQTVSQVHQELSRKERSLRIVGKHLSGVQRARRRAEGELSTAARRRDHLIGCLKAAEDTCRQVRDSLVQSRSSVTRLRPLLVSWEQLQLSGAESMMGTPEVAACQSFLSSVSQLYHACSCRIEWLEQEVSAHRGHVTALRAELQDACLRDNQAFVPLAGFEGAFPLAETGSPAPVLSSDSSKDQLAITAPAQSH